MTVKVHIEYWKVIHKVEIRFQLLGSFEITVNDTLIYSKLEKGGFPEFKEVIKEIERVNNGENAGDISAESASCIVL